MEPEWPPALDKQNLDTASLKAIENFFKDPAVPSKDVLWKNAPEVQSDRGDWLSDVKSSISY